MLGSFKKNGDMSERTKRDEYFANKALSVLKNNLSNIRSVGDWANKMGYSRSYLAICQAIVQNPLATSYSIAKIVGLKNENSIYKFLNKHFNTTFGKLRYEILNKPEESLARQMGDRKNK